MESDDISDGLNNSARRQRAAFLVLEGRMKDFMAAQEVGSSKEREDARSATVAAHEAYLDSIAACMWWQHRANGVDPENRG